MTITDEIRAAVPEPRYSCAVLSCSEQRSYPAAELRWLGRARGFYCALCRDYLIHQAQQVGEDISGSLGRTLSEALSTGPRLPRVADNMPEAIYACGCETGECYCFPPEDLTYWRGGFYSTECITAECGDEDDWETRFDGPSLAEVLATT